MGTQGLKYNMQVYNVFRHCSADKVLKVKSYAKSNVTSTEASTEELLSFVKGRIEENFQESKDKAVVDRSMINFINDDNSSSVGQPSDQEIQYDTDEEDEEEEVEDEPRKYDLNIKINDYYISYNMVKSTDFYILRKDTEWFTRSHMVITAHILKDMILSSQPLIKAAIATALEDASHQALPLADNLLRAFHKDARLLEKVKKMKKMKMK